MEQHFITQRVLVPPAFDFYWLGLYVPTQLPAAWPMFVWVVELPAGNRCAVQLRPSAQDQQYGSMAY